MFVYVINKHGEPLMPCKPRKARLLLRDGKAKVVKRVGIALAISSHFASLAIKGYTKKD